MKKALWLLALASLSGCTLPGKASKLGVSWAIALHGGAGVISREKSEEEKQAYYASLGEALGIAKEILARATRAGVP